MEEPRAAGREHIDHLAIEPEHGPDGFIERSGDDARARTSAGVGYEMSTARCLPLSTNMLPAATADAPAASAGAKSS